MATALTDPTKFDAQVEAQLGRAAGKIRAHDLLTGGLALAVLTLGYAVAGILLDRWLDLPGWVRQLGLLGFLGLFLAVGYYTLVRPLRRAINPRYAARKVERTVPDAKNALINWVDLHDEPLPDQVRAAIAVRAVDGVAGADVNRVGESRRLVWLGAAAGLLAAALAVLFVVLKPAPFLSLVGRTFNPFTAGAIATRTTIDLREPAEGDITLTTGDPLRVAVFVHGTVPEADAPDRLRLQVRYSPEAAEYDELPLEQAGAAREWAIQVPQAVVQNGFWYRVAGGDAVTPEYRVTVRSRPLVKGFEAEYEYPAYTRMKRDVGRDPRLEAYRGTEVTLTVTTNRPLKKAWLRIGGQPEAVKGEVVGDQKDAMRFRLTLAESGTYRVGFVSTADEPSEPTPAYPIKVLADQKPTVVLDPLPPGEEGQPIPANGQLKVNGTIGDDFGIDTATLRLRLYAGSAATDLAAKPYRDGKSFRREDNTWPTTLQYKDSVAFPELKDAQGKPVVLAEGMEVEYWLEATDNCTVPRPNVGRSVAKRVKIGPPATQPEQQRQQQQARRDRKQEEAQHQQQQDQQLKAEQRDAPPPLHRDQPPEQQDQPKGADGQPQPGQQPGQAGKPPAGDTAAPKQEGQPEPKAGEKGAEPTTPPNTPMPTDQPKGTPQQNPMEKGSGTEPAPGGTPPMNPPQDRSTQDKAEPGKPPAADPKIQEQADKVRQAIEQQERRPGQARPQEPADPKAERPPADPKRGDAQPADAAQPKAGPPTDPKSQPAVEQPAETKASGKEGQPQPEPAKPAPTPGAQPKQPQGGTGEAPKAGPPQTEERPAEARGPKPVDPAQPKPAGQPDKKGPEGQQAEPKPSPGAEGSDPKQPDRTPGTPNPGAAGGPMPPDDQLNPAQEKPIPKEPGELSRELNRNGQPVPPPKDETVERLIRDKAEDLGSDDPNRRQAAEKELDGKIGKEAREELQKKARDLKSPNPATRDAAKKGLDELAKKAGQKAQPDPKRQPTKEDLENLAKKAPDLASPDEAKRKEAEKAFDEAVGKEKREQLQKDAQDLMSGDKAREEAARRRLEEAAKQQGGQGEPSKEEMKKWADKAQDLNSPDDAKRKAAEEAFDRKLGKDAREELQQNLKDLQSKDQAKREAAQKKLEDMVKSAQEGKPEPAPLSKEDVEKLAQKAQDLNSPDDAKRKAAEEAFDRKLGKDAREQMQKMAKDLPNNEEARKRLEETARKTAEQAKKGGPQLSMEEVEKLARQAKDLASQDEAKRKEAEEAFDEKLGKDFRDRLQQEMKDLHSDDPKTREGARKRLEEMAKNLPTDPTPPGHDRSRQWRPGGGPNTDPGGKPLDDNPANRLKTAELQLRQFEKNKYNKELLDKLGYTEEEYQKFLKGYEEMVNRLRDEVAEGGEKPKEQTPTGPAALKVGEGSGNKALEKRSDGTTARGGSSGAGTAPPGYTDAQRKFAEQAAKLKKGEGKK